MHLEQCDLSSVNEDFGFEYQKHDCSLTFLLFSIFGVGVLGVLSGDLFLFALEISPVSVLFLILYEFWF